MSDKKMNNELELPAGLQQVYSPEDMRTQVTRMGDEISRWAEEVWRESHTDILAIPILQGGIFFFADLVRAVSRSVEIAPARAWAYERDALARSNVEVNLDHVPSKGRSVLLVDDICDSGRTLQTLRQALMEHGARDVRAAVMIRRVLPNAVYTPEWSGFEYPGSEWMIGYGMDMAQRWRNLGAIYILRQGLP